MTKSEIVKVLKKVVEKYEKDEKNSLREASEKLTIYVGFDPNEYNYPIFSDNAKDVRGCEYRTKITAPKGTYVMFRWNDEDCYFTKTPDPVDLVEEWTKDFQEQLDEGEEVYYEEEYSGGTELYVDDYETPSEAAHALYYLIRDQDPDGDSNYGVEWRKIEDFLI